MSQKKKKTLTKTQSTEMESTPTLQLSPFQMQNQSAYQPMNQQMGNIKHQVPQMAQPLIYVENPLEALGNSTQALVEQQIEIIEMLTGCETKNRYHVFILNQYGQKQYLFNCKEESGWCQRNCCPSDSRPFQMRIKHIISQDAFGKEDKNSFANFDRPFKCTCCCLARPQMTGTITAGNLYFGKVTEPCRCCDPKFIVMDNNNQVKWRIKADCCQCGFYCRGNFCGKLSSVHFGIFEGSDSKFTGNEVGQINKRVAGFQELITDADTFHIIFPETATPEEKLTLIGAVLLLDYRYYEDNGNDNSHGYYGYGSYRRSYHY